MVSSLLGGAGQTSVEPRGRFVQTPPPQSPKHGLSRRHQDRTAGDIPMRDYLKFYINGAWVDPVTPRALDVQNPANEEAYARISIGSKADVDKAVAAAKAAFPSFSTTTREYRADLLDKIIAVYTKRMGDIAGAISEEMGAPGWL